MCIFFKEHNLTKDTGIFQGDGEYDVRAEMYIFFHLPTSRTIIITIC